MNNQRDAVSGENTLESAYLNELFQCALEAIVMVDPAGRARMVNRCFTELFGYTEAEVLGRRVDELIATPDRRDEAARLTREVADGRAVSIETIRQRKDGTQVEVSLLGSPVRVDGRTVGVWGIYRDISERRHHERITAQLGAAIEQATDLIMVTDAEARILYVNPAFERITGYIEEEVLGKTPRILKSGAHEAGFYQKMWDHVKAGRHWRGRFTNLRADGDTYQQESSISPVMDRSGNVVNYVCVGRDVTRELELENQLRQAQKMEAVGSLTGGIAHDFNNLLTVVLSNASLMRSAIRDTDPNSTDCLSEIQGAAERGSRLIKKLLGFSRRDKIAPAPVSLTALVTEMSQMLQRVVPESIELRLSVEAEVPVVLADPGAVEQMLLNLVTNARDAMLPDGGSLDIAVFGETLNEAVDRERRWVVPGDYVALRVADTGTGMDRITCERAFDPFFTTKPKGVGTGLGLATTYGLVKQHGGLIDLTSVPGRGTTVTIYLPVGTGLPVETLRTEDPATLVGGTETILIVEDDVALARAAQRILSTYGYVVLTAQDGEEAVALCREHAEELALVLTDLVMPKMSGFALHEVIREWNPDLKFIFMSGYPPRTSQENWGIDASAPYLGKPWTLQDLVRTVRKVLDQSTEPNGEPITDGVADRLESPDLSAGET